VSDISKPWDWSKNTQEYWNEPSAESYYLLQRWKDKKFSRFLDLGCGLGRHSLLFANKGFQVNSFDLSSTAINELETHRNKLGLQNIVCSIGDMRQLPYPDTSFDCLLAYHVISHTNTQGIKTIINEIDRVLTSKGEFYLTLCSKKAWSFQEAGYPKHDDNTVIKIEDGPENGIPHFYSDEDTIKELLTRFKLITVKLVQDIFVNGSPLHNSWHYFILGQKE